MGTVCLLQDQLERVLEAAVGVVDAGTDLAVREDSHKERVGKVLVGNLGLGQDTIQAGHRKALAESHLDLEDHHDPILAEGDRMVGIEVVAQKGELLEEIELAEDLEAHLAVAVVEVEHAEQDGSAIRFKCVSKCRQFISN